MSKMSRTAALFVGLVAASASRAVDRPAIQAADAAMREPLPLIRFDNVALDDAIDGLLDPTGIKPDVRWDTLRAAGVDRKAAVMTRLRNVKRSKALAAVLGSVSDDARPDDKPVSSLQDDGTLLITTRREMLMKFVSEKRYDLTPTIRPDSVLPEAESRRQLESLVRETIAVGSWADAATPLGGSLAWDGKTMIVTQTQQTHREIRELVDKLNANRPPTP